VPTIDLSTPPPRAPGLLEALPRRVTLTLPELSLLADRAGGAPLPFETPPPSDPSHRGGHLEGRLGASRTSVEDAAYARALASLHDPQESLDKRGLLAESEGVLGAIGLLASPVTAIDLDITAGRTQGRVWHRNRGDAMAALATVDCLIFELVWGGSSQWPEELARIAVIPEELPLSTSQVPPVVAMPFPLADAAAEAAHSGRPDLIPVLAAQYDGEVTTTGDRVLTTADSAVVLGALSGEARGRLRALVSQVGDSASPIGVVSWTLLNDGWHAVRPRFGTEPRVEIRAVTPVDLATELAPVLAEVAR
jgi:hypothetical protein